MTATVLNIHEFYNELKGVGFNEQQAELIANLHSKSAAAAVEQAKHDYKLDDVATRYDIKELELKIEKSKNSLIMWMVSLGTAQVGAVFFILKLLGKA
jgi:uncharacterized protein YajQ (UPF0234 family)